MSFFFFSLPLRVGGAKKQTKQIWRQHAISTEKYLILFVFLGWCFAFGFYRTLTFSIWDTRNAEHRDNTRERASMFLFYRPPFLQSWTTWKISLKKLFDCLYNTQEEGSWSSLYFQIFCVPLFLYESKRETKIVILLWYQRWTRATLLLRLC